MENIKIFGIEGYKNYPSWQEKFDCENNEEGFGIYVSKETFRHEEEGLAFDYKYVIEANKVYDTNSFYYSLCMVVCPTSLHEKVVCGLLDFCGVDSVDELDYQGLIMDGGCGVVFGTEVEETESEEVNENILTKIANVFETMDALSGFYLDKKWNLIGNDGWDIIQHAVNGEPIFK